MNTSEYNKQYYLEHQSQRKQWYQKNAKQIRERSHEHNRRKKVMVRELIRQYKTGMSCKHCGNIDIRVLDFHHIDKSSKESNIAALAKKGWREERILQEISKCEILCANCHRILHWEEQLGTPND